MLILALCGVGVTMANERTIGIIVFDSVLTSEVTAPAEVFRRAVKKPWFKGWQVKLIGVEKKSSVTTEEGLVLGVDTNIQDNPPVNVLVVPGAVRMDALLSNKQLESYIRQQNKSAEWVSSNCSGAFLLANSGVLDGRRATTWSGGEQLLQNSFPKLDVVFNKPVVIDGRKLTSNGGVVSYQAALVLLAKLSSLDNAREIFDDLQMGKLVDWRLIENAVNQPPEVSKQ